MWAIMRCDGRFSHGLHESARISDVWDEPVDASQKSKT
jgi:hypothetical protein